MPLRIHNNICLYKFYINVDVLSITKYGSKYIGMAMVLGIIQYIMKIQVSLSVGG